MTIPEGYKVYSGTSSAVGAKAAELLSQDYGYREETTIDDKELLFVVETHTWYGATPDKPPKPHKGVTVYEKIGEEPETPDIASTFSSSTTFPPVNTITYTLTSIAAIGLGYYILKQIR